MISCKLPNCCTISIFALYKFGKIISQCFLTEARGLKGDQPPDHVLFMTRATSKLYSDCYMGCRVSVNCQLISKGLFKISICTKNKRFFFCISALASKKRSSQKNKGILYHYSIVRNKRRPYDYQFWSFFQALQPY